MDAEPNSEGPFYPMRVVARLSGVSPERVRAWESRYGAVSPQRSEGGTRRYSDDDVERLRLLRRVTEAGHRIGDIAQLDNRELRSRLAIDGGGSDSEQPFVAMMLAVDDLDGAELRRLLLAEQGQRSPAEFAREVVLPLAEEIGARWHAGRLMIAAEHRATNVLRGILVEAVDEGAEAGGIPRIVFASPSGEHHDLGVLASAIATRSLGADPVFVGADVPVEDLVAACERTRADVLALGFVMSPPEVVESTARAIRKALPDSVEVWIGGPAIAGCAPVAGVDRIESDARLEAFVLAARAAPAARKRA